MTAAPINLDGCRTVAGQAEAVERRRLATHPSLSVRQMPPDLGSLEEQMICIPAGTWVEVMQKWRFLLDRYSASADADDPRIQKLIKRAIGDMERLQKREERK